MQISTAYGAQKDGSAVLPRNKYTAIREDKPKSKDEAKHPEFKECKFTTEAIITEGSDVGTLHKVCANPSCPEHHPKQQNSRNDETWKAEQEKQRKEQAIANATGLRVLTAIGSAVRCACSSVTHFSSSNGWRLSWTKAASRCWHGSMASGRDATMEASRKL